MNSLSFSILALLISMVLLLPRRWALLAMAIGALYLTQAQQVEVLSINMFLIRFLEVVGISRVILRREFSGFKINHIDRAFVILYVYTTLVFLLRSTESKAYMVGEAVDALLCYFTFRVLIRDLEELKWLLRALVFLLIPYVFLLWIERATGHTPFTVLGVLAETAVREGKPRCVGSFRHPSLLGTLGASFLPLYVGLCLAKYSRMLAGLGIALCLGIVWFSNSGGPLMATAVGVVGWGLWTMRTQMRLFRWGVVGLITMAALVMKAPVWYLIARASAFSGGDGWHRSYLLDISFQHLSQWWFAGMAMEKADSWFPYVVRSTQHADITNVFISFGLKAGILAVILLIILLTKAFASLGMALAAARTAPERYPGVEFMLWGMGVMLAVHVANWFGITYFDQTYVLWFMHLAAISTLSQSVLEAQSESEGEASSCSPEVDEALSNPARV